MNDRQRLDMAALLDEAAMVLNRVREVCPDYWERFQQRDFLVDELNGCALMLRDECTQNEDDL